MDSKEISEVWDLAHRLADTARAETLSWFRASGLAVENKETLGFDPVTVADKACERAMRELIRTARPDDGILGEEDGEYIGTSGWTWVLDPIDGTRGFMSGTPTWGVLIALSHTDGPQLGVIDQPYIGERFFGGLGQSGFTGPHGARDLAVRDTQRLRDAVVFTTFPEVGSETEAKAFQSVAQKCKLTRYGMDCYAYGLLALGQIDLVIEAGLQPYDICGPIGVVQAAGGILTDWQGRPAHKGGRAIAAATPELHAEALKILSAVPEA